jgi:mono/diheme cytochrome c family protein
MQCTVLSRRVRASAGFALGYATLLALGATLSSPVLAQAAAPDQVKRGEFLVNYGGCNDCHSPKTMTPQGPVPDKTRLLSGYQASQPVPPVPPGVLAQGKWSAMTNDDLTAWVGPWGISFAANLTPDTATGLGPWTADQFVKTMRTGKHLGVGRPILPPMPVQSLAALSDADLKAIFAYLRSLKPIQNQVPAPIPPK